jgi:ATP-independent RNA helicase DbpA
MTYCFDHSNTDNIVNATDTKDFSSLPLEREFLDNLKQLDHLEMTAIQAQSLPLILEGKDILAQAKTGSGKTAAFAIGILHKLKSQTYQTQALVLCPTRELADQVSKEIRRLARSIANTNVLTLCGGKPIGPQLASLERNPHIVVGTPGRILKHLDKGTLKLQTLTTLVLDEADRMLDMGFNDEIMRIVDQLPKNRQTLLFSATYPDGIKKISHKVQNSPIDVHVESLHDDSNIKQIFYEIERRDRTDALIKLLLHFHPQSTVIFCNRKQQCQDLADDLRQHDIHALALHGDLEQRQRDQVLLQFTNKSSPILIATDVAARGLDIKDLQAVINFELSQDPEIHIHRIGRTGRAGNEGLALSLFMPSETPKLIAIEQYQNATTRTEDISSLSAVPDAIEKLKPVMTSLLISGGRKHKIRPGDVLGALTANKKISGKQIGKIDILDVFSYVAVDKKIARQALNILSEGKIKGRKFKVRQLS